MIRDFIKRAFLKMVVFFNDTPNEEVVRDVKRILVIRLDELGDMVLSVPFIRELRRNFPQAHISLVVKNDIYELVELCPYVDDIYGYKRDFGFLSFFKNCINMRRFIHDNDLEYYDLAIVPRWDCDCGYFAGMFAFLSHASKRIGYSENTTNDKKKSDKGYNVFYTNLIPFCKGVKHEVERSLDIVRYLDGEIKKTDLELWCSKSDYDYARLLLNYDDSKYKKRIALFMSAGSNKREWMEANFKKVIEHYITAEHYQFILMGYGDIAESKAMYIKKNFSSDLVLDLTGKTRLRETYAVLKFCDIYLGGDTGPMHMAVAAGLSGCVLSCHPISGALEHINSPARFGPWNDNRMIVLRPEALSGCENGCIHNKSHCINNISVSDVCKILDQFLY